MTDQDQLLRFTFPALGVRGEFVRLDAAWRDVRAIHAYPDPVAAELGRALAAVTLLSATIKFEGSLIMQLQGDGPLRTVVAQASDRGTIRGMAHWEGEVPDADLQAKFGQARLVLTARAPGGEQYQGIVALQGEHLGVALEAYFAQSEQLPTRLWLVADGERAGGLILQRLPAAEGAAEDWNRVCTLADTVTAAELLQLAPQELLYRLFNEERVHVHGTEPVSFVCGCSRERIGEALRGMGRGAVDDILHSEGEVAADCEFCNAHYVFDRVDVEDLFTTGRSTAATETARH